MRSYADFCTPDELKAIHVVQEIVAAEQVWQQIITLQEYRNHILEQIAQKASQAMLTTDYKVANAMRDLAHDIRKLKT